MVILAPSLGPLWGGRTPKTHSPGHRCPPIVIGKSFLSAGRAVFLDRWHWSIHHGFVPLRTLRAHQGSAERAIYHPAEKNRVRSEQMHILHSFSLNLQWPDTFSGFRFYCYRGTCHRCDLYGRQLCRTAVRLCPLIVINVRPHDDIRNTWFVGLCTDTRREGPLC